MERRSAASALTYTALLRLSSIPAVVGELVTSQHAARALERMTKLPGHVSEEITQSLSTLECPGD